MPRIQSWEVSDSFWKSVIPPMPQVRRGIRQVGFLDVGLEVGRPRPLLLLARVGAGFVFVDGVPCYLPGLEEGKRKDKLLTILCLLMLK